MKNGNTYPEVEWFGRFCLKPKKLFEESELSKKAFDEHLKDLRDCKGAGWLKNEATEYLITGKAHCRMYAYGTENGRRYRRSV